MSHPDSTKEYSDTKENLADFNVGNKNETFIDTQENEETHGGTDCPHKIYDKENQDSVDELVRDIIKVGYMSKSEARRRINNLLTQNTERIKGELEKGMGFTDGIKVKLYYNPTLYPLTEQSLMEIKQQAYEDGVEKTEEKIKSLINNIK